MTVDMKRPVDAAFRHFGKSAAYTPPDNGTPIPCTIIPKVPDVEDRSFTTPGFQLAPDKQKLALLADVRESEVATPVAGGFISYNGHTYPIRNPVLLDTERNVWRLALGAPT